MEYPPTKILEINKGFIEIGGAWSQETGVNTSEWTVHKF